MSVRSIVPSAARRPAVAAATGLRRRLRGATRPARELRAALERVPPLATAAPRELMTMAGIAVVAGDWPTALAAAERRLARRPGDEGALVARAVALWELGREEEARHAVALAPDAVPARARAALRFHHHLDEPAGAQAALDALDDPEPALVLVVGDAWRRHGELARAVAAAERVLARDPANRRAQALRRAAVAEGRLLDRAWRPPEAAGRGGAPVRGRVLHMLQRSLPQHRSGSTYRTHYTVTAQAGVGLEPAVLTQPGFGAPGVEHHGGIAHHRLPAAPPGASLDARLAAYVQAAGAVVERVRPAVLHPASDYVNGLAALELGRRHRIPVVYEVRGFPEELRGRWSGGRATYEKSIVRRRLEIECWRSADRVVTLAEVMKDHIVSHGVPPERVVVVPNAVDVEAFAPRPAPAALRARLGIPAAAHVVGYVSTLVGYEGLPYLVEATARLAGDGHAAHALIVGDGKDRTALAQLARRLGVADRVHLPGRVDHAAVPDFYALMDVFVVPRTDEVTSQLVTPLKPYEAMAAGCPVVVARTAALSEMVREGETGLTFAPEDAADLARVLAGLLGAPAEREALGRRARAWVAENRTWAGNAQRYLELYRELGAV